MRRDKGGGKDESRGKTRVQKNEMRKSIEISIQNFEKK